MVRGLFFTIVLLFAFQVSAQLSRKSAVREAGTSYLNYKLMSSLLALNPTAPDAKTVSDSAVPYSPGDLPNVTEWSSFAEVTDYFQRVRDERWLTTLDHPGFLRRSSWLYPDDGCFVRAALAIMNLAHWNVTLPNKIFVFGNLNVNTPNSPSGSVNWWYHVAPIVQVQGQKYVLDPALNPHAPMKLEDWLILMVPDARQAQVAICNSGAYIPDDTCARASDGQESTAASDQLEFLTDEWDRLQELNRNPVQELGDSPPWLSPSGAAVF